MVVWLFVIFEDQAMIRLQVDWREELRSKIERQHMMSSSLGSG